jgi:hypothetical protein
MVGHPEFIEWTAKIQWIFERAGAAAHFKRLTMTAFSSVNKY